MKRVLFMVVVVLFLALSLVSCKKNRSGDSAPIDIYIKTDTLVEKEAEIIQNRTIPYSVKRWSSRENEIYAFSVDEIAKEYFFKIMDFDTLAVKRTFHLPCGDMQSPSAFYCPTHFEYINGRYFLTDQYEKIVVYDKDFHFLYASMYHQIRHFIDFFKWDNRVMFVIGTKEYGRGVKGSKIQLFTLPDREKPEKIDTLASFEFKSISGRLRQYHYETPISPITLGFEKDGKIYYSDPMQNVFRIYDLKTRKNTKIELSFLKPKKFSDKQVSQFAYRFGDRLEDDYKKTYGFETVYKAYPEDLYYFGLFDVGKDKIGFIGDLDLDSRNKYRLDIIDCKTFRYIESIWFPIGSGFHGLMVNTNKMGNTNLYDVDKGLFIWGDLVGEERDFVANISRYKLKTIPGTGK